MRVLDAIFRNLLLYQVFLLVDVRGLHLTGEWNTNSNYLFLAKFGFQKTEIDELKASRGYIYGKIASPHVASDNHDQLATLVVVDGEYILDIHANVSLPWWSLNESFIEPFIKDNIKPSRMAIHNARCEKMFSRLSSVAWHHKCAPTAQLDFLRSVPCKEDGICPEEDDSSLLVAGSQFTYTIQDTKQPRYWYIALVACRRNLETCHWEATNINHFNESQLNSSKITYDIWLVNGDPILKEFNKFEHQFSFEDHELLEVYIAFLIIYTLLAVIVQFRIGRPNCNEPFPFLLVCHLWLCVLGLALVTIHLAVFSINGQGAFWLNNIGLLISRWSDSFMLLLVMATAEHWFADPFGAVRAVICHNRSVRIKHELNSGASLHEKHNVTYFATLLLSFVFVQTALYIWALLDQDPVVDVLVWNTTAGCILLALRFCIILWFLATLRLRQIENEQQHFKQVNRHIRKRTSPPVTATLVNGSSSPGSEHSVHQRAPGEIKLRKRSMDNGSVMLSVLTSTGECLEYSDPVEFIHFAAGFLLWLLSLPLIVFIAETGVSALWRKKTITIVTLSCDYVGAAIYTYLLISTRNAVLDNT